MRSRLILPAPLAILLFLAADRAAERRLRFHEHGTFSVAGNPNRGPAIRFLPELRAFVVQIWLVRIDGALKGGRTHAALRLAREVLAIAPDLPAARVRLSDVLGYNLPPLEIDPARRLAWIAEALRVLDEGLERDPYNAVLHAERGILIRSRGEHFPEFAAAFERTTGRTTLDAGVDAQVAGAEFARGQWWPVRAASVGLLSRAQASLERGDPDSWRRARADFRRAADYLGELIEFSRFRKEALEVDREIALAGARLAETMAAGAGVVAVDAARRAYEDRLREREREE